MAEAALLASDCPQLELVARGKVRDVYRVDSEHLLLVASDRLSAFDVVMRDGVPGKGRILTQLSVHWFQTLAAARPHHLVAVDLADMPARVRQYERQLRGRAVLVKAIRIHPVEAIVRGYLSGSGWKAYQEDQAICGVPLPPGLDHSQTLPAPIFTPSTKAERGAHDEHITADAAAALIGRSVYDQIEQRSLACYHEAAGIARERGIIIADTKFEFGRDEQGALVLGDEILTPDSSRFWPADDYQPGRAQDSFDKQPVRDWLEDIGYDKRTPLALPSEVVSATHERYVTAFRRLVGRDPEL